MSLRSAVRQVKRTVRYFHRRYILRDVFKAEVRRWFENNGDRTLRLSYDLKPSSVVFDLGGYLGDFADSIHQKYRSKVFVFEPSRKFYESCVDRFRGNEAIHCFNFGLSDVDGQFKLSDEADASTIKPLNGGGELVSVRRFKNVYEEVGSPEIDLLKINIEGGEYDILPHLIETGIIRNVKKVQVQFHNFIPGAGAKRDAIVAALEKTHKRDWCYIFVWESWSRK